MARRQAAATGPSTSRETAAGTTFFGGLARLVAYSRLTDERGTLVPIALDELPFQPARVFAVADVPRGAVRGGHGHRRGLQCLLCLRGAIEVRMRHRGEEVGLTLHPDRVALLIGPDVWCQQTYLTAEAVLLVFASEPYDPASYFDERD